LKVLHLVATLSSQHGGPSKAVPAMCEAMAHRGHSAEIMTTTWKGRAESSEPTFAGGARITYHPVGWPASYGVSLPLARDIGRRLSEFDVVHVHQIYFFHDLVARVVSSRDSIPSIISPHGVLDPFHRRHHAKRKALYMRLIEARNLERATGFHYASDAERDHAEEAGLHGRAWVVPLAVKIPPRIDAGRSDLKAFPKLTEKTLVTFLGRLTAKKRVDLVVEAFARIAAPNLHLAIAGPDGEGVGAEARKQVDRLGIRESVSFLGLVTGEIKTALLGASDVLVLPSEDESFGLTVVEAMAAGVPVVISDRVAVHKEVLSGEAGLVVDRSPEAIADGISSVLSQGQQRRMGENGRSLARSLFSPVAMADGLEKMYLMAIDEGLKQ
jgi:glycosyltransferase involved in cell wall biosynthesis